MINKLWTKPILLTALVLSTAAIAPAGAAPGDNPRFSDVAKQLDQGGSFYLYIDVKDQLRKLFSEIKKELLKGEEADPNLQLGLTLIEQTVDALGLFAIEDIGISSAHNNGLTHCKGLVRVPGERKGLFQVLGGEPHPLDALRYAPADTVLFRDADLDLAALYDLARQVVSQAGGAVMLSEVDQQMAAFSESFGVDIEKLIRSLSGSFTMVIRLDEKQRFPLPDSGEPALSIPMPMLAFMIGVKDSSLYDAFDSLIGTPVKLDKTSAGDPLKRRTLPEDITRDIMPFSPEVAFDGSHLILASHSEMVDQMLKADPNSPRLSGNKDYQRLSAGLPEKGNDLAYISPRLGKEIQTLLDGMRKGSGASEMPENQVLSMLKATPLFGGMAALRVNDLGGLYVVVSSPGETGIFSTLSTVASFFQSELSGLLPNLGNLEEGTSEGAVEEENDADEVQEEQSAPTEKSPSGKVEKI